MEIETIVTLIGNFGFPITIAMYLLFRFEKTIITLACEIRDLKEKVGDVEESIKYRK